jgi:hypothetical protein
LAHNQSNGNGDTEEFVDNGKNDKSEEMEPEDISLTLANFKSRLSAWTIPALQQTLAQQKRNSNWIPPEIQEILN